MNLTLTDTQVHKVEKYYKNPMKNIRPTGWKLTVTYFDKNNKQVEASYITQNPFNYDPNIATEEIIVKTFKDDSMIYVPWERTSTGYKLMTPYEDPPNGVENEN